jgi:hypothetical protein
LQVLFPAGADLARNIFQVVREFGEKRSFSAFRNGLFNKNGLTPPNVVSFRVDFFYPPIFVPTDEMKRKWTESLPEEEAEAYRAFKKTFREHLVANRGLFAKYSEYKEQKATYLLDYASWYSRKSYYKIWLRTWEGKSEYGEKLFSRKLHAWILSEMLSQNDFDIYARILRKTTKRGTHRYAFDLYGEIADSAEFSVSYREERGRVRSKDGADPDDEEIERNVRRLEADFVDDQIPKDADFLRKCATVVVECQWKRFVEANMYPFLDPEVGCDYETFIPGLSELELQYKFE